MTNPKQPTDSLPHSESCSKSRSIDVTPHSNGITTRQCVECGAHQAIRTSDGTVLPRPTATGPMAGYDEFRLEASMEAAR